MLVSGCVLLVLFVDLDRSIQRSAVTESSQQTVAAGMISSVNSASSPLPSSCTHRMHVFRMRLLHFVNSLHDYIMTRVCCSYIHAVTTTLFCLASIPHVSTTLPWHFCLSVHLLATHHKSVAKIISHLAACDSIK